MEGTWLFPLLDPDVLLSLLITSFATVLALTKMAGFIVAKIEEWRNNNQEIYFDKTLEIYARLFVKSSFLYWGNFFGLGVVLMILHITGSGGEVIIYGVDLTCLPQVASIAILGLGWGSVVFVGFATLVLASLPREALYRLFAW